VIRTPMWVRTGLRDIIPKDRGTRGNIVNQERTMRPQHVIVMVV
jgi:hypothetical protein